MRGNYLAALLVTSLLSTSGLADDNSAAPPQPKSAAAVAAIHRRDVAVSKSLDAYQHAIAAADKREIDDLEAALGVATRAGNLDETEAIRQVIKDTEKEADLEKPAANQRASSLEGSTWQFSVAPAVLKYLPHGVLECNMWHTSGTWSVIGPNVLFQKEPGGRSEEVTFTADGRACVWEYNDGTTAHAQRIPNH